MMKDGRPSLINDIRHFQGASLRESRYLKGLEEAVAFGRRMAWFLNGERVSLGAYPALYLLFTPSLEPGAITVTDEGGDWWQRYTYVGVPSQFPDIPNASELVVRGTIDALKAIRSDLSATIDTAERIVASERQNLRFLLKERQTKRFIVEISSTISDWPQPSHLVVALTDRSSGEYFDAEPVRMRFYLDALDLAGTIRVSDASILLVPNQSIGARLTASSHGGEVDKPISEFFPRQRPVMSKRLKPRG
jgi:hypothetical protein